MLNQSLIIALSIYGFSSLFWEKMIFQKVADKLEDNLPDWLTKPLFACPVCMTPWYGSGLYWLVPWEKIGIVGPSIEIWPIIILTAMGINAFISQLTGNLEDIANDRRGNFTSL